MGCMYWAQRGSCGKNRVNKEFVLLLGTVVKRGRVGEAYCLHLFTFRCLHIFSRNTIENLRGSPREAQSQSNPRRFFRSSWHNKQFIDESFSLIFPAPKCLAEKIAQHILLTVPCHIFRPWTSRFDNRTAQTSTWKTLTDAWARNLTGTIGKRIYRGLMSRVKVMLTPFPVFSVIPGVLFYWDGLNCCLQLWIPGSDFSSTPVVSDCCFYTFVQADRISPIPFELSLIFTWQT